MAKPHRTKNWRNVIKTARYKIDSTFNKDDLYDKQVEGYGLVRFQQITNHWAKMM